MPGLPSPHKVQVQFPLHSLPLRVWRGAAFSLRSAAGRHLLATASSRRELGSRASGNLCQCPCCLPHAHPHARTVLCDATQKAPSQVQPGSRQDASSHPSNKVFLALPAVASPPELSNFGSPGSEGATGGLLSWNHCRPGSRTGK